jgi:hypothetical protein
MRFLYKLSSLLLILGAIALGTYLFYFDRPGPSNKLDASNNSDNIQISEPAPKENPVHTQAQESIEKPNLPIKEIEHQSNIIVCKPYFIAFNNLVIKFFQRENFSNEIELLQKIALPVEVADQVGQLSTLNNYIERNIIENKIISKMIRVEKVSENLERRKDFVTIITNLQQYFYSPEFINNCK